MGFLPDVRRPGGPRPSHPPGPRHAPEDHRRRGQGGRGYVYYDTKITLFKPGGAWGKKQGMKGEAVGAWAGEMGAHVQLNKRHIGIM